MPDELRDHDGDEPGTGEVPQEITMSGGFMLPPAGGKAGR